MHKKFWIILTLLLAATCWASDIYNPSTNQLTIASVEVSGTTYNKVKIEVGRIISVEGGTPKVSVDSYNPTSNELFISSVKVNGLTYNNVVITVGNVLSVGSACTKSNCPSFVKSSNELEDPAGYYTCKDSLFLNMVDTIDMNQDGVKDLVLHYWCNQWNKPTSFDEQTPNSLVVYLSRPDGSYKISNQLLFNQKIVELTGASRNSKVADFNKDGYPDIVYAMNHEDGRPLNDQRGTNQSAQTSVLMSAPNGQYRIDKFGPSDWYHGLSLAKNTEGGYDAVLQGFGSTPKGFRYSSNQWRDISDYPQVSGLGYVFIDSQTGPSSQMVTSGLNSAAQLQSFNKINGNWTAASNISYPTKTIPFLTWQGTEINATTISVGNDDIVAAGFVDMCSMNLKPNGNPYVLATLTGNLLKGGYNTSMGRVKEGSQPLYQSFQIYEVINGQLVARPSAMVGEDTSIAFNKFDCKDVNSDGLPDLVGYPVNGTNGQPVVYLNNGEGQLVRVGQSTFPMAPSCYGDSASRMTDLDGDGISDLIIFRTGPSGWPSCSTPPISIYYGVKPL